MLSPSSPAVFLAPHGARARNVRLSLKWICVGLVLAVCVFLCHQSNVAWRLVGQVIVAFLFGGVVCIGLSDGLLFSLKLWFVGAAAVGLQLTLWLPPTITRSAATSVRPGMTMDEVRGLLGQPMWESGLSMNGGTPSNYTWGYNVGNSRSARIEFFFDAERRVIGGGVNERGYTAYR